jgi:uncharacterized delta-60 repeat protein
MGGKAGIVYHERRGSPTHFGGIMQDKYPAKHQYRFISVLCFLLAMMSVLAAATVQSFNAPGDLDPTFSGDGKLTPDGAGAAGGVAIQPDGKIVVAGSSAVAPYYNFDFAVARYNPDGSPDTTFGGGTGKVTTDIDGEDISFDVAIQADGKIVVVGESGSGGNYCNGFVIRYNPDGSLDTSFDVDGIASTPTCDVTSVAIQPADGKIVVIGWGGYRYLIRYNPDDGSLDSSFGQGGIVNTNMWSWGGHGLGNVNIQTDGKIMALVGYSVDGDLTTYRALVRYNSDGLPDTGFGTDGRANAPALITDFTIQSDGKIVAAGGNSGDFAVVRYDSNGSPDTGFGFGGIVTTPIVLGEDGANSVAIQPNGKIVAAGYSHNGSNWDFALTRYDPNGSLDATFGGGDGITTVDFDNSQDSAHAIELDSQGRAVVVGGSDGRFAITRFLLGDTSPSECAYSFSTDSASFSAKGGVGGFNLTTDPACSWAAISNVAWITVNSGADTGDGSVTFTVSSNSGKGPRSGTINVGSQIFTVSQDAPVSRKRGR